MTEKKETCGNCHWGVFMDLTAHRIPRPQPRSAGYCRWPARSECPNLPLSMERIVKIAIRPEWELCPAWEKKGKGVNVI